MAKRGGFPGGGMPGNMNNLMKQAQRMQRQMEESPVSYTHLDVYKRQTVWRPLPSSPSTVYGTTTWALSLIHI